MDFKNYLEKYIDLSSFCLVGNAPVEINKGKGKEIDQYQSIIRFNDYSLSHSKDYGSKVNIWMRAKGVYTHPNKDNYNHDLIILRALGEKNLKNREIWEKRKQTYIVLPIDYEVELSKLLKSIPSTGLLLLYVLKEHQYVIADNLYGFTFESNRRYFKSNQSPNKHNWKNEKIFFENTILEK